MAESIVTLTSGLYDLIESAELVMRQRRDRAREGWEQLQTKAHALSQRFQEARERAAEHGSAKLAEISDNLRAFVAELEAGERAAQLRARWTALGRQYEALRTSLLSARVELPAGTTLHTLKPRNLNRNLFHVGMSVFAVVLYEVFLGRSGVLAVASAVLVFFLILEALRRWSPTWNERFVQRVFSKISRPGEAHRTPSAVHYMAALFLGVLLMPQHAIELGTLVLGFGDPAASLAGKRWGRRKLVGDKSLAGTLAFFGTCVVVGTVFLLWVQPALGVAASIGIAAATAAAGAIAELYSRRLDDNFTIPMVAGLVAMLLL
jgi:dolichol kinase